VPSIDNAASLEDMNDLFSNSLRQHAQRKVYRLFGPKKMEYIYAEAQAEDPNTQPGRDIPLEERQGTLAAAPTQSTIADTVTHDSVTATNIG
jgi:hypothetical protein